MKRLLALALATLAAPVLAHVPPAQINPAIYTDPPHDHAHPAGMEVLHIPSGGVKINGVAYTAAGAGRHPVLVLMHGLPGNEKNLDLAQAVRRAGWTVITFNYRGSWGSPGRFSFAGSLEDARAVLAYLRDPANAERLAIDPHRVVLAGHSMGGWVAAMTAERDPDLAGTILISPANIGGMAVNRTELVALMADNMESLAGVTADSMADEVLAHRTDFDWTPGARALGPRPLLILTADDGLAPMADALAAAAIEHGGQQSRLHVATDHSWSDARIQLEQAMIAWLKKPTESAIIEADADPLPAADVGRHLVTQPALP